MVFFVAGQDGAVSVIGVLILYDGFSPDSPEDIQQLSEDFGTKVCEITISI